MERLTRLTTDVPKDNVENALNLFYVKDGWTWIRSGGPAPDYADMPLHDFVRMLVKSNIPEVELPEDNDALSDLMCDWLTYDPDSAEGIISLLYTVGWAFAELRHRLAAYEDTGLEPEEIAKAQKGMQAALALACEVQVYRNAAEEGRLLGLPCPMGSTIYMIVTKHTKGREPFSFIKTTELMESNVFRVCRDYGKTVFLTREEAKRALEGGQST